MVTEGKIHMSAVMVVVVTVTMVTMAVTMVMVMVIVVNVGLVTTPIAPVADHLMNTHTHIYIIPIHLPNIALPFHYHGNCGNIAGQIQSSRGMASCRRCAAPPHV